MEVWTNEMVDVAMGQKPTPLEHGIEEMHLGFGIAAVVKDVLGNNFTGEGIEIGCGVGRVMMHITNTYRMTGIEGNELLAKNRLISNIRIHNGDFFKMDLDIFKR